jgi:flagellar hook-associated protein 3 FlgL
MRLTFALNYEKINRNIQLRQESLAKISTMAASGKRLVQPADDPLAWSQAMDLKQGLREFDSIERNINHGVQWNQATENGLNSFSDLLIRAKEAGMRFSSASTPEARAGLVNEIDQITEEAYNLSNSRFGDLFLFSGKSTSTQPFQNGSPTSYFGDQGNIEVRAGATQRQAINLDGGTVFFTDSTDPNTSVFKMLTDLKTAMQAGDTTQIQTGVSALETAREHISAMQTKVGARLNQLEEKLTALTNLKTDRTSVLADTEEADMVDVLTQLQQKRTALEAALRVTTYADGMNLTQYLR